MKTPASSAPLSGLASMQRTESLLTAWVGGDCPPGGEPVSCLSHSSLLAHQNLLPEEPVLLADNT